MMTSQFVAHMLASAAPLPHSAAIVIMQLASPT
jgi:hypothetical protein